jgi:hypothetical protein
MQVKFTITATLTTPPFTGERRELYFGEKKTRAGARKHADATVERLRKKLGSSYTTYQIEYAK